MTIYVLNTLVIPIDFERYERVTVKIRKASVEEVRRLLQSNQFVSAVGHQATAVLLTQLLKERLPEGKVLSYEELQQLAFELAISEVLEHGHQ
jgi:curli biogenesis system outer membrane secretion channel CsgG